MSGRDSSKKHRHEAIKNLIEHEVVHRQEEIVDRLGAMGFSVTQSSVSRDLSQLKVGKVSGRYVLPSTSASNFTGLRSVVGAGDCLVVLRTETGAANFVAARLDELNFPEVLGTIAGDDTIFVATASREDQKNLLKRLGSRP